MKYIFFSLRDFQVDVGETVRSYGLLNSLASNGHEVILISNAKKYEMFHPSIKHVFIGYDFKQKRKFQGLLALFSYKFLYYGYKTFFNKIKDALQLAGVGKDPVYFLDYLDNSIGYVLKKKNFITKYINDIHGIATIEFLNHIEHSKSFYSRAVNRVKYRLAYRLDKKVFESADGLIYGSDKMKKYYEDLYDLRNQKSYVIPYLLAQDAGDRAVDEKLKLKLQQELNIKAGDFTILFVGSYKPTAGVDDLLVAFDLLFKEYRDCKLLLIGAGPERNNCIKLADKLSSNRNIYFIENIPYAQLSTYQALSKVIVCPDKNNLYSQYIIHIKYFDALMSGKLVINGSFESVKEINKNDFLSLSFEPSNVDDLYKKLKLCRENYESLTEKYKDSRNYTRSNLTYKSFVSQLAELNES
jgi:glycosyltransferase involved in cell wall biosynthesis